MRNSLVILGICLILASLFSFLVYAQGYGGDDQVGVVTSLDPEQATVVERKAMDAPALESKEARLERMISAFDRGNYQKGMLVVSFKDGTSKDEVVETLEKHGLVLATERVCGPETPEEPGTSCTMVDRWNENLLTGTAGLVPVGEEKSMAQQLIIEEGVIWVEPEMINTLAQEQKNEQTEPQVPIALSKNVASEGKEKLIILTVVGVIALIGLIAYLIHRRRRGMF